MFLLVLALLAALVVGWLRNGTLDRLGTLPLRSRRLVLLAFGVQLAGTFVGGPVYPVALAASAALVVAFLALNRSVRGTGLIALGLLANALVVGANGAMPVSPWAAARAGVPMERLAGDARHEVADDDTRLLWLSDVVPVVVPWRPEVVSPGDVLVTAGAAQLVVVGITRRPAGPPLARRATATTPPPPARPGPAPGPTGRSRARRPSARRSS